MSKGYLPLVALALLLSLVIIVGCKDRSGTSKDTAKPDKLAETSESVQSDVDTLSGDKVQEKRNKIMQEAVSAIRETRNALRALDNNETEKALAALEKATGKLELILVRQPELALAPINVSMATYDMLASLEDIQSMRQQVEDLIDDGKLQEARRIIGNLCSEIVVSVVNIPLATYPQAIKAVTPLIDKGKVNEAKTSLVNALNTLVVTDHIISLPVIRAEKMLELAEEFAEKEDRTQASNDSLATLLDNARYQLKMAEALGYGEKKEYKPLYRQITEIEAKTGKGKSGKGFFDDIKGSLGALKEKLFTN